MLLDFGSHLPMQRLPFGGVPCRMAIEPLPGHLDVHRCHPSNQLAMQLVESRLGISDQTVKFHLATISGKLGAVNRTDAVRRAVRRGLIAL